MSNFVIIEANKEHKKTMKALKGLWLFDFLCYGLITIWLFMKNVIPAVLIIAAIKLITNGGI